MFSQLFLLPALAFIVPTLAEPWPSWGGRPTATIQSGTVVGVTSCIPDSPIKVNKFLGIPFAAPPVRFAPAQPPTPWTEPLDASNYRPACLQQFPYPELSRNNSIAWFGTPPPPAGESEDCLNLNVWVPVTREKGKAVLVWIYGGSLRIGSGSLSMYEGANLAAKEGIIVVTFNYRTNVFGFPGSPELPRNEENLGFLDQRFALEWVQKNIAAFGGDPKRVTIAGESAGAGSVDALLFAPPKPLTFSGAIMQSGTYSYNAPPDTPFSSWMELAALANCTGSSNVTCLRELPATALKSIIEQNALRFWGVIDDVTYIPHPTANRKDGNFAQVPVFEGTTANEGTIFTYGYNTSMAFLNATFPGETEDFYNSLLAAYPIGCPGISDVFQQISAIVTEYQFQCPANKLSHQTQDFGQPSWRYYYNATFPNQVLTYLEKTAGVYHSSEIELAFGTYAREGATDFQIKLSRSMQNIWGKFIRKPYKGPGWGQIPEVGVLGGGVRWDRITEGAVLEVIDESAIDQRCGLFAPLYTIRG